MDGARVREIGLGLALLVLFPGCTDRAPQAPASAPAGIVSPESERHTGRRSDAFANIELTTQHGERVRFYDDLVRNRTVIVNFMYTRCTGT